MRRSAQSVPPSGRLLSTSSARVSVGVACLAAAPLWAFPLTSAGSAGPAAGQDDRAATIARVEARISSIEPREAAWGAFEARTLALTETAGALLQRLSQTPVQTKDDAERAALQRGILDALVALDATLSPDDARMCFQRGDWATLLLVARRIEGHEPFLNELVTRSDIESSTPLWKATRLILARVGDASLAESLMSAHRTTLTLTIKDPPEPGPKKLGCGYRSFGGRTHWSHFDWVPEGFPPTASWQPQPTFSPGSIALAQTARHSQYVSRIVTQPGRGGGGGGGSSGFDARDFERDLLLDLAGGPDRLRIALEGWSRRFEWTGQADFEERLSEWESEVREARETLIRRVCERTKLEVRDSEGWIELDGVVVDERVGEWPGVRLRVGWRLQAREN